MRRALQAEHGRFHGEAIIHRADGNPADGGVGRVRRSATGPATPGRPPTTSPPSATCGRRRELETPGPQSAQTREQARIARDLHDGVAQQLAGLNDDVRHSPEAAQSDAGEDISQETVDGIAGGRPKGAARKISAASPTG